MSDHSSPIASQNPETAKPQIKNITGSENNINGGVAVRRERPSRACTLRAAARLQAAAAAEAEAEAEAEAGRDRKRKKAKRREKLDELEEENEEEENEEEEEEEEEEENGDSFSRMITPLLCEPEDSQLPRLNIRSMWQLGSILNFLNVFRPLLNIKVEFSAEELETALLTPNTTLADVHMPILKAIPPVARMALGHTTWITVLCRKLRHWWHWVAEGDLPIVASHGAEVEAYSALDPGIRVVILKALCDIRIEQEDIWSYIDDSIKHGVPLSAFRKERLGGDSYGVSYWYEDDPIIGHRLYREIREVEVKKGKGRNIPPIPHSSYQWEAVATNLDEFQSVSEKLFSSKNRTEVSVAKKLKNDKLPEIEKVHKRKEKQLKKQHREALMLDSMIINMDGLATGRSLRGRKPVTYTFDDYDRSINEALKATKNKKSSPESYDGRDPLVKLEVSTNGGLSGPSHYSQSASFSSLSPKSSEDDELYDAQEDETLERSNRRRQRPQRFSVTDFVEAVSDNESDFDSDDDIVGEAVYDDDYIRKRKQRRKISSSSEGDEEYQWDEENPEEEEEEEEQEDTSSTSDESDGPRRFKVKTSGRTRRQTKSRPLDDIQSGLRRSKRATRNRINYRQYEMSESDNEQIKPEKSNTFDENGCSNSSDHEEFSAGSRDFDEKMSNHEIDANQPLEEQQNTEMVDDKQNDFLPEEINHQDQEVEGVKKTRFLDLNELAPGSGFEDGPSSMRDEDGDEF